MSNKRQKKKAARLNNCALCGRPLPREQGRRVVGRTGLGVCDKCLRVGLKLTEPPKKSPEWVASGSVLTPQQLMEWLDRAIIGQERAKRAVSVVLWKQQLRAKGYDIPNPGLLLFGPTGCGKTALVKEAAKAANLPFIIYDATTLTETGYKGNNAVDIVKDLRSRVDGDIRYAVVCLDEIDKLAARGNESRREYSRGTQHALLKLVEGTEVDGVSTDKMLFLYSGAFTGMSKESEKKACRTIGFDRPKEENKDREEFLPSDFVAFGMEPELMGRISRCVPIEPLTENDLRNILLSSSLSHFQKYRTLFGVHGQTLELDEEAQEELIQKTLERGLGARGLNALLEEWIEPKLMRLAEVEDERA